MSMMDKYSPSSTRNKMSEPNDRISLSEEVRSGPVQELKTNDEQTSQKIQKKLLDQYEYHPEVESKKTEELKESKVLKESYVLPKSNTGFSLLDLSFFCEERLFRILYEPIEHNVKKIRNLEKQFLIDKVEVYAEYSKDIELKSFKDKLFYYKGEVLIPEEYFLLSGFLRQYFKIEQLYILYKTGEIILRNSKYCNFWFDKKISKIFTFDPSSIERSEMLAEKSCLECNLVCPFRKMQQMPK